MCDSLAFVDADGAWFAKTSDRPPSEVQLIRSLPARAAGAELHTQYLDLGTDPGACRLTVAAQPTWLWGLETGINEHRLAVGNETVYTTADRWHAPPALLGMDLVRLVLERAATADAGVGVLTQLLEAHGQGGSGWEHTNEPYFSSFLLVDPHHAWIVETSQREWAARRVDAGGAAISNRLAIGTDWQLASDAIAPGTDWQTRRHPTAPTGVADHRLAVTSACVSAPQPPTLESIVAALRNHGAAHPALPAEVGADFSGVTVCMHVRGYQASASSIVSRLPCDHAEPTRHWIALGSPCVSVYVPATDDVIAPELGEAATWCRFVALRDRVEADPTGADELAAIRAVLDPVERELWAAHEASFAPVDAALARLGV